MKHTLIEYLDMIQRGESEEEYIKRKNRLHKLSTEMYDLEDAISVLGDDPRSIKKKARLEKIKIQIEKLKRG